MSDFFAVREAIAEISNILNVRFRIIYSGGFKTSWGSWVAFPSHSYIEVEGCGPILIRDIVAIEVDPIEEKKNERQNKTNLIDHSIKTQEIFNRFRVSYENKNGCFFCACSP